MGLEKILERIVKSPGTPGANDKYESNTLTETADFMKDFSEIQTGTTEGLKKYRELTGLGTGGISTEKIKLKKKQIGAELEERFDDYVNAQIKPITEEISEKERASIGYTFCPSQAIGPEKYNKTREAVYRAKETIEAIQKDPAKYIKETIESVPDFMKGIVGRFPDEVCDIDAKDAQKTAFANISKYGATNFVTDTYNLQKKQEADIMNKIKKLTEKRKEAENTMPLDLDAEGEAKYFTRINEETATLREEMSKITDPKEIRNTILYTAIETIKKKKTALAQQ